MTRLDRIADRMMDSLPKRRLAVIFMHCVAGGIIFGALARWMGWPLLAALFCAACASAWVTLAAQIRGWWR